MASAEAMITRRMSLHRLGETKADGGLGHLCCRRQQVNVPEVACMLLEVDGIRVR